MPAILILGGARSGKSRYALALAEASLLQPVYIATGWAGDEEMAERIAHHRHERPSHWITIEEPLDLCAVLHREGTSQRLLVIDCLTLWLSNLLGAARPIKGEIDALIKSLAQCQSPLILVSNEVGLGLVPETPLGRQFRDWQGWLNQAVAAHAERVIFVAAGLPLILKDEGQTPHDAKR